MTVVGTSIAIWLEGTHTCVAGHDFIPPNVLFLYKIEINHKIIIYTFWENIDISSKSFFFQNEYLVVVILYGDLSV